MKIRMVYLIHAVFALVVAGALSFGANRAFASSPAAAAKSCPAMGYAYEYAPCGYPCPFGSGYCDAGGTCRCGLIP